jgi:hypothetical protein
MRVAKRGNDGLIHWAPGEGFSMAACSGGMGGRSSVYIVDTLETLGCVPVTCLWCVLSEDKDARIH